MSRTHHMIVFALATFMFSALEVPAQPGGGALGKDAGDRFSRRRWPGGTGGPRRPGGRRKSGHDGDAQRAH